ncbi:MAG: HD domain-containing protein [Lachnospiraceae bacterium]|nr:HD domain-containing protein [Lachnospiraceae bacterium]
MLMKGMKRKFAAVLAGIILSCNVLCIFEREADAKTISGVSYDEIAVNPTNQGDGFSSYLYDNKNGLPTSEANAIAETSEGFIWIGSYSGLIRYDGNSFERMDSTNGISSVVSLFVDSKDRLWIGTNDNGVAVMDKGEFFIYDLEQGLRSSSVRSITEDSEGNIYIASTHGLNMIGQDMVLKDIDEVQLNNEYICELRMSDGGTIYGETLDGDIFTIKNGIVTMYPGKSLGIDEEVNCVLPDPINEGYVYIGSIESTIYHGKLDGELTEVESIDVSPLKCIASIEIFKNQIWACGDNGISVVNENGKYYLDNVQLNNSVEYMLVDYEGNLWFTSSRQGIMKIVPNRFTNLFEKYGLDTAVVNSTCLYSDKLFIGTDNGLVVVDSDGKVEDIPMTCLEPRSKFIGYTNLVELLEGCRIRSIIKDSKGRLLFSTYSNRGLVIFDDGMVDFYDYDRGLPSNKVRTVFERSDGIIMVACSGGMAMIDNGEIIEIYDEDWGLNNPEVLSITESDNKDMIIGSDGNGIYIINGHNVRNLGKKDGLSSEVVMRIKRDPERHIFWIVTSNSIGYMTEDYQIHTIKNFPYSNNFDMYENSQGEMWILSSNGIYVIPVTELLANEEINPVYFSMSNGLPCVATANSYSDMTSNGILYIAGTTGVAKVNIEETMLDISEIKMAVPYIEADGVYVYPDSEGNFTVPSSTNRLTIYNYIFTYSLVDPKITYWLDGFDKEFITLNRKDMEPVVYTNLDGGTYHFIMILQDELGKGNKQLDITIVKTKAFYEMAWFRLLLVLGTIILIAGAVAYIVRRKTLTLSKKNEQNRLFINEMTQAFAKTIDMKDKYTNGHSQRVADYTAMLTKELGYDEETVERYRNIALLHDIGKISIPPEVLNKEGKLTDQEFNIIKSHSAQGYMALKDISIMPELAVGAGQHHERPDGKGYPKGLKGDEIERVAQIIAVADTFDAMYSDRPYRKRMNFEKAVSIIKEVSGTQLTEDVVDAFLRIVDRGGLRAEDDNGGGSTEDIDNIHKKQEASKNKK